jgi:ApbE superfamily uncharacterized protein (UPF0280 family)
MARTVSAPRPLAVPLAGPGIASGGSILAKSKPMPAVAALLPGRRLHLQHGPIDLVVEAFGDPFAVRAGYARAAARFATVLEELVAELPALRGEGVPVVGVIARRMAAAVAPFRPTFITPMAAVAGAVAEEVLRALAGRGIARAYANNGGDIALWLAPGESLTCALAVRGGPGARHCNLGLVGAQLQPRDCGCSDRTRPDGGDGRCGSDDDCECS